jgi:transposase-like protein
MSNNDASSFLKKYGEWLFRTAIMLGLVANLYMTQNFVTQTNFKQTIEVMETRYDNDNKSNQAAHLLIQTSVADIATTMKLIAANQLRVDDHEARLRIVEGRQIDVISRLTTVEKTVQQIDARQVDVLNRVSASERNKVDK